MFSQWRGRTQQRSEAKRRAIERLVPFRKRFDPILLFLFGLLFVGLIAVGGILANGQLRFGWFDPDPLKPFADDRLAANLRDEQSLASGPFVGASYLANENSLSVLREKGLLHKVDLKSGLWSDEDGLKAVEGIESDFTDLSPACSTQNDDALSHCPDPNGLFAYTAGGGLVMRSKGAWRTVISDTRFVGVSGTPVQQEDVVGVAASASKRWLLLATKGDGLGLFDLQHRRWVPIAVTEQKAILGDEQLTAPSKLVALEDEFLLATHKGVMRLGFGDNGQVLTRRLIGEHLGAVLDISVYDKAALILSESSCEGGSCLALYKFEKPDSFYRLFGETRLYRGLSQTGLSRALVAEDGKAVFMLGAAGVYRYDRLERNWEQMLDEAVSASFEAPSLNGLYFATPGKVGFLDRAGKLTHWALPGQKVISFAQDKDEALLAQTAANQTWRLDGDGATMMTSGEAAREPLDKMKRSVYAFDRLVMIGEDYLVLHDILKRSYVSIPRASLSSGLLLDDQTKLFGGKDILWALQGDQIEAWRLAGTDANPMLDRVAHTWMPSAPRAVHMDGNDLLLVDERGRPFRGVTSGRSIRLDSILGKEDDERGPVHDVMSEGDLTYLARDRKVSVYSLADRGYVDSFSMPIGEDIRGLARANDQLFMLGSSGSLIAEGSNQRLTGSNMPFAFASSRMTDAITNGMELFLAASDGVTVYSPDKRSISEHIDLDVSGPLRFAGLAGAVPIVYDGKNAWFGHESLSFGGARVLSASKAGDEISTLQNDGQVTFLARYPLVDGDLSKPSCYYRNPGPSGKDIIDVAAVPGLGVVALVEGTLWVRDQAHRRFVGFTLSDRALPLNARMSLINNYLVIHNEQDAWIVATQRLRISDSCSPNKEEISSEVVHLSADQLAVSKARNEIGLLHANGAYQVWKDGAVSNVLTAPDGPQPTPRAFQSAARLGASLYFSDAEAIWRYDSVQRHWLRAPLLPVETNESSKSDIWADRDGLVITMQTGDGLSFGGSVDPDLTSVSLLPLTQWNMAPLPIAPEAIRDVVRLSDGKWLYLTDNAVVLADGPDSQQGRVSPPMALPFSPEPRTVWEQNGQIVIADGASVKGASSLLILDAGSAFMGGGDMVDHVSYLPQSGETVFALADKRLLIQSSDGAVRLCGWKAGKSGLDGCRSVLPPALSFEAATVSVAYALDESHWLIQQENGAISLVDRPARQQKRFMLKAGSIDAVLRGASGFLVRFETGDLYDVTPNLTELVRHAGQRDEETVSTTNALAPRTEAFLADISAETGGLDETRLEEQDGQIAVAAGAFQRTRLEGTLNQFDAPQARNPSVQWDRETRSFSFLDENGASFSLSPSEAMPGGRFAFAQPGKPVMLGTDRYMVANRHGLWFYQTDGEGEVRWKRMSLPDSIQTVGHGRIYFADGRSIGEADMSPTRAKSDYSVSLGALQINARIGGAALSASWSDGLQIHDAFSEHGFRFDMRQDVAFSEGDGWFLTPVGLVGAQDLSLSAPQPAARTTEVTSVGDKLFALEGRRQWLVYDVMRWQRAENPFSDRQIAYDQDLLWLYQNGRLITRSTTRTMSAERRLGLRFESDILFDAAFSSQGLVVRLGDGVRQFANFDALSSSVEASSSLSSGLVLATRAMRNGEPGIVALTRRGAISRVWNGHSFERVAYEENPDIERVAATMGWLRVRFVAGEPSVDLKTEIVGFEDGWAPIAWKQGEPMPMDRFLSIHGEGDLLYAGTSAGLQILSLEKGRIVSQRFVELGRSSAGPQGHEPVHRIGRFPLAGPAIYALGDKHCLTLVKGTVQTCSSRSDFSTEDLGQSAFWRWQRAQGRILLSYKGADGRRLGGQFPIAVSGRFPHDELDDLVFCQGGIAQSWKGNVSLFSHGVGPDDGVSSVRLTQGNAVALSCQTDEIKPSLSEPAGFPAGLYAKAADLWRWTDAGVVAAGDLAGAYSARADNKIPFEANQLRVRNVDGRVRFEYRDRDFWRGLETSGGRLAIDDREGLISSQGQVWAYTPQGFVSLNSQNGTIDPLLFSITSLAYDGDQAACSFDRARTANDGSSFLRLSSGDGQKATTVLRCLDGRLWQGNLGASGASDRFVLQQDLKDPYASRRIVGDENTGVWLIGRSAGREGMLQFRWHGEENGLAGGRFALDDIRGIAQIEPDHLEVMTGLGWARQPIDHWEFENAIRPANQAGLAAEVRSFGADADVDRVLDRDRGAVRSLCLQDKDGLSYRWRADGQLDQVEACDRLLAEDGVYAYRQGNGQTISQAVSQEGSQGGRELLINTASLNGVKLSRRLVDGQFTDLVTRGHAVLSQRDGAAVVAVSSEKRINLFDLKTLAWAGAWALSGDPQTLFLDEGGAIGIVKEVGRVDMRGQVSAFCSGDNRFRKRNGLVRAGQPKGFEVISGRAYVSFGGPDGHPVLSSFACDDGSDEARGDMASLEGRVRYLSHYERWERPDPLLWLEVNPQNRLQARVGDLQAEIGQLADGPLLLRRFGDQFIILDSRDIYIADLDALLSYVIEEGRPHD